jgi:hypothetical protein
VVLHAIVGRNQNIFQSEKGKKMLTGKRSREDSTDDDGVLLLFVERTQKRQEQVLRRATKSFMEGIQTFFSTHPPLERDSIWDALKTYERTFRADIEPLIHSFITQMTEEPGTPFYGYDECFYAVMCKGRNTNTGGGASGGSGVGNSTRCEWDVSIRTVAEECFQRLRATPELQASLLQQGERESLKGLLSVKSNGSPILSSFSEALGLDDKLATKNGNINGGTGLSSASSAAAAPSPPLAVSATKESPVSSTSATASIVASAPSTNVNSAASNVTTSATATIATPTAVAATITSVSAKK